MAEFATNNHINASTGVTSFFADYRFYPQTGIEFLGIYKNSKKRGKLLAANRIVRRQENMIGFLQNQLA